MKKIIDFLRRHVWWSVGIGLGLILVIGALTSSQDRLATSMSLVSAPSAAPSYDADFFGGGSGANEDYAAVRDVVASKQAVSESALMPAPPGEPSAGPTAADAPQRLIKTGELRLEVSSVDESARAIGTYVDSLGGFTENSTVYEGRNGIQTGSLTVRVPVEKFDSAITRIRDLAVAVRQESVRGQDVTEQYTDLEARLKNARAQEQAYLLVLDKARTVEDILKVQQYLGGIRGQIESYEGQLQYLANRTSLSTINVYLEETVSVNAPTREFAPMTAAKEAVQALVYALEGIAIAVIWFGITGLGLLLPALAILFVVVWSVKRLRRPRK